jgi:hypothetical protein
VILRIISTFRPQLPRYAVCRELRANYMVFKRIKPAHPEQSGRHQRMHLTLKKEAAKFHERTVKVTCYGWVSLITRRAG